MKNSPLQLDDVFVGKVSVTPCGDPPQTAGGSLAWFIDAKPSYSRNAENPLNWFVELSVDFRGAEQEWVPYEGHIECEGYFTVVDTDFPEEKQRKVVAVNAATILYSTAREIVASITARGRRGKVILPSVSFIDQQIAVPDSPPQEPAPAREPAKSAASE